MALGGLCAVSVAAPAVAAPAVAAPAVAAPGTNWVGVAFKVLDGVGERAAVTTAVGVAEAGVLG